MFKNNITKALSFILISVFIGLALYFVKTKKDGPPKNINSFEECVNAGYPAMDSYPEQCKTPEGKNFTQDIGNELELIDEIAVDNPRPNTLITSPLTIAGRARGMWYFEANFSAELYNDVGMKLGQAIITAEDDWMSENFVPFSGELSFERPGTAGGTLILRNANPSGLEEDSKELRIPVNFSK